MDSKSPSFDKELSTLISKGDATSKEKAAIAQKSKLRSSKKVKFAEDSVAAAEPDEQIDSSSIPKLSQSERPSSKKYSGDDEASRKSKLPSNSVLGKR